MSQLPPNVSALLDAVPIHNQQVKSRRGPSGELILTVPMELRWFMRPPVSWLLPVRRERSVALDKLGEQVWSACDGEQTVEAIVEEFAAHHRLSFHESRLAVMQFLRDLTQRALIVTVVPRKESGSENADAGEEQE
ncbi:hypothetical protein DB346_00705 [Verrucomicrobia bacterium LW23]|nr:hypothetical protein DB346_00705 [Verrucomicrobia bacterium LW23]